MVEAIDYTYRVFIGRQCPTDCCLGIVEVESGETKEYTVESGTWIILDHYYNGGAIRPIPKFLAETLFYYMEYDEVDPEEAVPATLDRPGDGYGPNDEDIPWLPEEEDA